MTRKKLLLPAGIVSFPNLFRAESILGGDKKFFTMTLMYPPEVDLKPLERLIAEAAHAKFGDELPPNFRDPMLDGDEMGRTETAGMTVLRLKAGEAYRPEVVGPDMEPIIDPAEIYPGCWARSQVSVYAYDMAGNKGVGLGMGPVQKTADGERIAGGAAPASSVFTAVTPEADDDNPFGK